MKFKAKRILRILLAAAIVLSMVLTAACDRDHDDSPTEISQPETPRDGFAPPRGDAPTRPDTPLPERNPDGSLG